MRQSICDQFVFIAILFVVTGCGSDRANEPVKDDEAMRRAMAEGKTAQQAARDYFYPRHIEDYFRGMDSIASVATPHQLLNPESAKLLVSQIEGSGPSAVAPQLTPDEVLGRNTWMIWCAGNEGFWDWLANENLGFIDLLKLVDTRRRNERFRTAGMINEPQMQQGSASTSEYGLWLDQPADESVGQWREAYVARTFDAIGRGAHKSQRGLKVFRGDARSLPDDCRYEDPASYVRGGSSADYASGEDYSSSQYDRIPPPDIYGLSSGVIGLRLFPNPNFDAEAQRKWDADRYYNDASYYSDPKLVRPYRVGMSCAFCHASFHPLKPPRDVTHPEWENISGNIGAQYLRMQPTVGNLLTPNQFVYHLLDSQPAGTIDTSLIASDNINNPNTFNAIFRLPERGLLSFRNPREKLSASSTSLRSLWESTTSGRAEPADPVPESWREVFAAQGLSEELQNSNSNPRRTPRILLDGSDSIGAWGAFARVYLNIGSYYERWNQLHQPLLGFEPQRPFTIADCRRHSVYWHATTLRVGPMRDYFLKITPPMPLLATEGSAKRLQPLVEGELDQRAKAHNLDVGKLRAQERARHIDVTKLALGRQVFARNCIVCHSSIQPESSAITLFLPPAGETAEETTRRSEMQAEYGKKHAELIKRRNDLRNEWGKAGEFWDHDPGQWLRDPAYNAWASEIVELAPFWQWNYLSTDYRVPVNVVGTNSGRALATNALTGHMWADFSSQSYRELPSPGGITYFNPYKDGGKEDEFHPRHKTTMDAPLGGGGPGFYRVPTLLSIWATAPLLHNNSLGLFNNDPSVDGRLDAFDDAIRKLLWPERRLESSSYNNATPARLRQDHGLIWRTTEDSYFVIKSKFVPQVARQNVSFIATFGTRFPWLLGITPPWLPSASLLFAALVLLQFSNSPWRRKAAIGLFVLTVILGIAMLAAFLNPDWEWLAWLRSLMPGWFPIIVLLVTSLALLWPISRKWIRYTGYLSVAASLVIGSIVYFNAGRLGDLRIGPVPKGTPVNLIANVNSEADPKLLAGTLNTVIDELAGLESRHESEDERQRIMKSRIAPELIKVSKCPDFVMDRGHYFEWFRTMSDEDKDALIELLKTF